MGPMLRIRTTSAGVALIALLTQSGCALVGGGDTASITFTLQPEDHRVLDGPPGTVERDWSATQMWDVGRADRGKRLKLDAELATRGVDRSEDYTVTVDGGSIGRPGRGGN